MSNSDHNVESLIHRAEAVLSAIGGDRNAGPSISEVLAEIQSVMSESPDSGKVLGPLLGKLRTAQNAAAESPIHWIPVLEGHLAIGHRPKIKLIKNMRNLGATHVLTLLSESEGAESIGNEVRHTGLDWIYLPLESADPPADDRLAQILQVFEEVRTALNQQARIYIHCSAGIHRTGMITYAFLRHADFSADDAMATLARLRQETADGVGDKRRQWGEQFTSQKDI